jgi:hypothetical protein
MTLPRQEHNTQAQPCERKLSSIDVASYAADAIWEVAARVEQGGKYPKARFSAGLFLRYGAVPPRPFGSAARGV